MFKIKSQEQLSKMDFKQKGSDYVVQKTVDGVNRILFTIYKGSPYIRVSRTGYVSDEQLRYIYIWTKNDFIEWEDD